METSSNLPVATRTLLREVHNCIKNTILYLRRINELTNEQTVDAEKVFLFFHAAMTNLQNAHYYWEALHATDGFDKIEADVQYDSLQHNIDIVTLCAWNRGTENATHLLNDFIQYRTKFDKIDILCLTRISEPLVVLDYQLELFTCLK